MIFQAEFPAVQANRVSLLSTFLVFVFHCPGSLVKLARLSKKRARFSALIIV